MEHYAGIDVSLERSSVCVVDATGRIIREAKVASEPEALVRWTASRGVGSEHHAAARMSIPSMPARASAGVR
jgi:transposase